MKRYEQMMMPLDLLGIICSMSRMIVAYRSMILLLVYSEDQRYPIYPLCGYCMVTSHDVRLKIRPLDGCSQDMETCLNIIYLLFYSVHPFDRNKLMKFNRMGNQFRFGHPNFETHHAEWIAITQGRCVNFTKNGLTDALFEHHPVTPKKEEKTQS